MKLSEIEILELYLKLESKHKKYLEKYGVKFPKLKKGDFYTKDALVLIYLFKNFEKPVSKEELTNFLGNYGERPNDVQQGRHLGQQKGWYIISGQRKDSECEKYGVSPGQYALINLKKPYPGFTDFKRDFNISDDDWTAIKEEFDNRCVTCGSVENEPNLNYPNVITELQKGHMDPNKPLSLDNIIPQCSQCNRQDRDNFVYDKKGRVRKINNPRFILKSDKRVKEEMLKLLKKEFE